MTPLGRTGRDLTRASGAIGFVALAACAPIQIGSRVLDFGGGPEPMQPSPTQVPAWTSPAATASAETFGRGPVPVALLLPLSGDPALAQLGRGLANASRQAIAFVEQNPNIAENITITLRDTGSTAQGAMAAAQAAVAGGARLVLGPLTGDQVSAAATVTRQAGVPMIAFANNPAAAGSGVYLLSVLPEAEFRRSLGWAKGQGKRGVGGIFPATPLGDAQAAAFLQEAMSAGYGQPAIYRFSSPAEAQGIISQALPAIRSGSVDVLFMPDRATAPAFASALAGAGSSVQIVGSSDWAGDPALAATPGLAGAIYPGIDPAGLAAIAPDYQERFGAPPPPLATIAYTATILANVNTLSMARPPFSPALLTTSQGFSGRDGMFRFRADGRAEYPLEIRRIAGGGSQVVEAARL